MSIFDIGPRVLGTYSDFDTLPRDAFRTLAEGMYGDAHELPLDEIDELKQRRDYLGDLACDEMEKGFDPALIHEAKRQMQERIDRIQGHVSDVAFDLCERQ